MPSTMASASSSARPAKTALSSKVQGLKFMQRAEARQALSGGKNSPAEGKRASSPDGGAAKTSSLQAPSAQASSSKQPSSRQIVTLDDNAEHWSFASGVPPTRDESEDQGAAATGWNSWLIDASTSSNGKTSKGKQRRSQGAEVGRRTYGKFGGGDDDEDEGEEETEETGAQGDNSQHHDAASQRRRGHRKGSLEPQIDFDKQGQLSIREQAQAKKQHRTKQQTRADTSREFIKPGTMAKKKRKSDAAAESDGDGIDLDSFDLSESFGDPDPDEREVRRGGVKKSKKRRSGGGGGGGISK